MNRSAMRRLSVAIALVLTPACTTSSGGPSQTSGTTPTMAATSSPPSSTATSPSPGAALAPPASLPSVGRILFVIEGPGGNRPVYLDPGGLHEIPTKADATLTHASWASADSIIFDSARDVRRHVFRMGIDGRDIVELTSGDAIQERPSISPDGSTIVYADFVDSDNGADLGLHLANADGTNARTLTDGGETGGIRGDTSASFSPDGRWIAFERAVDFNTGKAALFIIKTDGTGLRRLTDDSSGAGYPRWSPNGKQILFTQRLDASNFAPGPLWIVDVDGRAPRPLTDLADAGWSFQGDWSPDGRQIVFDYYLPALPQPELRVVDADGTHPSTLWRGGAETPDWGP